MNKNIDYKQKYKELKLKLKSLIYENETYHEQLKRSQNEYLQVTKDRDYLLDRLLAYENVSESDSTDCTDESETEIEKTINQTKLNSTTKKKKPNETSTKKKASVNLKSSKKAKSTNVVIKEQDGLNFNCLPLTSQFEDTKAIDKVINLNNDTLNKFHHELNQDKLMFNDASKSLFNNELNGNLDIDSIDLVNLNGNLDVNLTNNLTSSLSNNLCADLNGGLNSLPNNVNNSNINLNSNLNGNLNSNLNANSTNLNTNLSNINNLHSNLNSNLDKLNFDFESQSNQSLLLHNN